MKRINLKNMEPLTEEEKAFSADLENYNQFFRYMRINKLDQEEWYDILILHYLRAVKKYLNIPRLQQYEFGAVLFKTLDSARSNYCKSMIIQKRMPEGGLVSLDNTIEDEKGKELHVDAWLIDRKTSVERQVISKESFFEFLDNIEGFYQHEEMKAVLFLLLNGYTKREVIKYCRDRFDNYDPVLPWGIDDFNFIVRQLRSAFKESYGF